MDVSAATKFLDGSEMAERIRAHDWSDTPLGSPAGWPLSLKTAVSMVLGSKFPSCIFWGEGLLSIPNDAFLTILGAKPDALGRPMREVWAEIWDDIMPIAQRAMAGESTFLEHLPLTIQRGGPPEDAYFTFCYSPIRDEDGLIVGFLDTVIETTGEVKARATARAEGERLRELFQQAPGFMCVLRGPQHIFELANDAYRQLVGHRNDPVGKSIRDVLPEVEGQGFFELLDQVYATGEPFVGQTLPVRIQRQPDHRTEERFLDLVYQPTRDAHGAVTGIFAEGSDVTERVRAERALRESETKHRQILDSATDYAVIATDLRGRVTRWSEGARRVLGWDEGEMLGRTVERIFTPEDVAGGQVEAEMRSTLETGFAVDERWHLRKGERRFWANGEMTPLRDDAGRVVGFVKVMRDRTEQRRAEEHQRLLIDELNHRVKNTLATVQSLANQTFRNEHVSDETRLAFEGRLFALARGHDVLTRESWEGAELEEIVAEAVAPYRRGDDHFTISGPKVRLTPRTAIALAMALHELATNAAKYGALSVPTGRVSVQWSVTGDEPRRLTLRWEEVGGPPVVPPSRTGFGTRLVQRSLAAELEGEVRLSYEVRGVTCSVMAPLAV